MIEGRVGERLESDLNFKERSDLENKERGHYVFGSASVVRL